MKNNRVLFIDDEPDILTAVKIILESEGFVVKTKPDIKSIKEVIDFDPNLIILDALLLGKTAKQINDQLKSVDQTKNIPIIILSANPLSKLKTMTSTCGAKAFLQKPFDMDVLVAVVKKNIV